MKVRGLMFHSFRFPLIVGVVGLGVAGLVMGAHPGGIQAAVRDVRDYSDLQQRLAEDAELRSRLEVQTAVIAERIALKDAIIDHLIAGETTLADATERFYGLNRDMPSCLVVLRTRHPHLPEGERMALNVLEFVTLRDLPVRQHRQVMTRLTAEYRQMFGHAYNSVQ